MEAASFLMICKKKGNNKLTYDTDVTTLTWCSSFFFTLIGLSSSSSSRLTLEATLESALITFEAETALLPIRLDDMPVSKVELGVTVNGFSK